MGAERWLTTSFPILMLTAMLASAPHGSAHGRSIFRLDLAAAASALGQRLVEKIAMQADIEAVEADAQQALVAMIWGGLPNESVVEAAHPEPR